MRLSPRLIAAAIILASLVIIVVVTALLVPQETNPAFAVAVSFVESAGKGDDTAAEGYLSDELRAYVTANCPDGSVSACIDAYTPPEWGKFVSAVYRRSQPDGSSAWDILLIATYAEGRGFSGICIYNRVEEINSAWKVTRWSGWIPCGSGLGELIQPDAANRAP